MNRSKIEWCDHTWNPITGCKHGCQYCYARIMTARFSCDIRANKMARADYRTFNTPDGEELYILDKPMLNSTGSILTYPFGFAPTFHRYRLNVLDKLKMGNNIFVGAMADVFGDWVPDEWLDEIFDVCANRPIHNYLFLTKNPERYTKYRVPIQQDNFWYGTTITSAADADRLNYLPELCNTYVSIEPLMGDIAAEGNVMFQDVDWVIIGAETGRNKNKIIPELDWIKKIVVEADKNSVPVFMKDSLIPVVGEKNMRREFPKQLQHSEISPKLKKKLYDNCSSCEVHMKKSEMITLLARSRRGEQPKQFGFMCKNCFMDFCKSLGIDLPELDELEVSITIEPEGEEENHGKEEKL